MNAPLQDTRGRPLDSIRLSVTDRCNLRCAYCMPEAQYHWLERSHLLSFEELVRLAGLLRRLGASRLRLTGGEPLLRRNLARLVSMLQPLGFADLAMTSNGVLLAEQARALRQAGLQRLTVSLDTLRAETFLQLTRREGLKAVLRGLEVAAQEGFAQIKLDTVLIRGVNDQELPQLVNFAHEIGAEIRFIEYMDVAGATHWSRQQVVSESEILRRLRHDFGETTPLSGRGSAPARRYRLERGQTVGIIASVTQPFCGDCDRLRVTADGQLLLCLYARQGLDIRQVLRSGEADGALEKTIAEFWRKRKDQGAVERAQLSGRSSFVSLDELRLDPRLEMHTRGG